ncbi:MAG: PhpK family radical SAM P-methyltransferase [Acidobacteria bacterium]|nr:PhpK family radical SAM P-methyltransferase [Acidobacteriota bacterium]
MQTAKTKPLDCIVIGYNEVPFQQYESFLHNYGVETEAYRDLQYSFVNLAGEKLDYVGLLNRVLQQAGKSETFGRLKSGDIPNLAAVYLTNYLRRRGLAADYINLFQDEKEQLIEYLAAGPLCVAITTTFYVVNLPVIEMVEFIRRHNPEVKIVVGGPLIANHARNNPGAALAAALDDLGADLYLIEGQGEQTLAQVVAGLKAGWRTSSDFSAVPNLAYFEGKRLKRTPVVSEDNSLDENFIDWQQMTTRPLGRTIQTRTARSCAFKCAFCNYPTRAGALTLLNLDVLERELDSIQALEEVQNVVFIDDTFNVPIRRFKDICRLMIAKRYRFKWFSYFRCSNSDEEAIELMARSGCQGVFLGIESGAPQILTNMEKAATIEKYARGIELLRQHDVLTFASFITGFPGETEQTVQETIQFLQSARPDYYRTQMWYCEPGTPIQRRRDEFQIRGEGFVWEHATMDSLTAMDQIDRLFLTVNESLWLPQWSFDFWIIPYLLGRGLSLAQFREFMTTAHKLLALEIAAVPQQQKQIWQQDHWGGLVASARGWR